MDTIIILTTGIISISVDVVVTSINLIASLIT
jgi:hypothetical protein